MNSVFSPTENMLFWLGIRWVEVGDLVVRRRLNVGFCATSGHWVDAGPDFTTKGPTLAHRIFAHGDIFEISIFGRVLGVHWISQLRFLNLNWFLRPLGNCGSGRMDDDGMNWWNEESGRKREHPEKTHEHGVCPPQCPHGKRRVWTDDPTHQKWALYQLSHRGPSSGDHFMLIYDS